MSRKWNRVLAFFLAVALVFTTFGSDFASAKSFAADGETVTAQEETPAAQDNAEEKSFSEMKEDIPEVVEEPKEEEAPEAAPAEEAAATTSTEEGTKAPAAVEGTGDEVPTEQSEAVEDVKEDDETSEDAEEAEEETEETEEDEEEAEDAEEDASLDEVAEKKATEGAFSDYKEIDGIRIEVSAAAGVLPADAELRVDKISGQKAEDITDIIDDRYDEAEKVETISFDIKIWSPSLGDFVQPKDGTVDVKFADVSQGASEFTDLSVYHVEDNLNNVEPVGSADSDTSTEVSFDAKHFSIYTVAIVYKNYYGTYDFKFNAYLVDDNGKEIKTDITSLPLTIDFDNVLEMSDVAPKIDGYTFKKCVRLSWFDILNAVGVGAQTVSYLKLSYDYIFGYNVYACQRGIGIAQPEIANIKTGYYYLIYTKDKNDYNLDVTDDHLDLGFTDVNEYEKYYNGKAKVYATVGNTTARMYPIGYDDGTNSYEYRLYLGNYKNNKNVYSGIERVSVNDSISFKVDYKEKEYEKNSSTELNKEASNRCYTAHKDEQEIFGFDYLFSFTEEFTPVQKADVIYYANYEVAEGAKSEYEEFIKWNGKNSIAYKVKDYTNKDLAFPNRDGFKFLGWSTDKNAKKADDNYRPDKKIIAYKGSQIKLYAVWESTKVKTSDHLDLGFTDYNEYSLYANSKPAAEVYAIIGDNGKLLPMYPTGQDADIKSYEYRLYLGNYKNKPGYGSLYCGVDSVSVSDKVTYVVKFRGNEYRKEATSQNQEASDRCINAHSYRQNVFGFDYLFSFTDQFELQGDVYYHANYDVKNQGLDEVGKQIKWSYGKEYEDHEVLTYAQTGLYNNNVGYAFKGWATSKNSDKVAYIPGNKIQVKNGDKVHLYAVWETVSVNIIYHANYKNCDDPVTDKGEKGKKYTVKDYDDVFEHSYERHDFLGWYTNDLKKVQGDILVCQDLNLYACWSPKKHVVKYVNNDGSLIEKFDKKFGDPLPVTSKKSPEDFKKVLSKEEIAAGLEPEDFEFVGWSDETLASFRIILGDDLIKLIPVVVKYYTFKAVYCQKYYPAYYQVRYHYAEKNGTETIEKSELRTKKVTFAGSANISIIDPDDKQKTKNGKYVLDESKGTYTGVVKYYPNSCKNNPAYLDVYYCRPNQDLVMAITAASAQKSYDGTPLSVDGSVEANKPVITFTKGGAATNAYTATLNSFTYEGSVTDAGVYEGANKITAFSITFDGQTYTQADIDKDGNVTNDDLNLKKIVVNNGNLTVNGLTVEITVPDDEKVYDGKEFADDDYSKVITPVGDAGVTFVNLKADVDEGIKGVLQSQQVDNEIDVTFEQVKVGEKVLVKDTDYVIKYGDYATEQPEVKNLIIHIVEGDLVIKPAHVTLKSKDLEKFVDGIALVNGNEPLETNTGWVDGEGADITFTGSQTEVGESPNKFECVAKPGTDFTNYVFVDANDKEIDTSEGVYGTFGTLKVKPLDDKWTLDIELNADGNGNKDKVVEYDGESQSVSFDFNVNISTNNPAPVDNHEVKPLSTALKDVLSNVLSSLGSIFTIKASAGDERVKLEGVTRTVTINGKNQSYYIDNIYYSGGAGIDVKWTIDGEGKKVIDKYPVMVYLMGITIQPVLEDGTLGENIAADVIDYDKLYDSLNARKALSNDVVLADAVIDNGKEIGSLTVTPRPVAITAVTLEKKYDGKSFGETHDLANQRPSDAYAGKVSAKAITLADEPVIQAKPGIVARDVDKLTYTYTDDSLNFKGNRYGKTEYICTLNTCGFNDETTNGNYDVSLGTGTLTVIGENRPNRNPDDPDPREEVVDTPTAFAAVLGARREAAAAEGAVLGARRGGTEDPTNNAARIIVIVVAAGIAISIMFFGRKKEDGEK